MQKSGEGYDGNEARDRLLPETLQRNKHGLLGQLLLPIDTRSEGLCCFATVEFPVE